MQGKAAVIGDYDSVLAFKAGGVDAFGVTDAHEAKEKLKSIAKDYSVIFITEDLASEIDGYLKRFLESAYPIVIPVPGKSGKSGYSEQKLRENMERALGVDILFRDEHKGDN